MNSTIKISYGKAAELNEILGKLKTKSLTSSLYILLLRFKNELKKVVTDFAELQKAVYADYSITPNFDNSITFNPSEHEKINLLGKAMNDLTKGEVEISRATFLSVDDFEKLRHQNDLTLIEEEMLVEYLVNMDAQAV